jgi:hypothetical protein
MNMCGCAANPHTTTTTTTYMYIGHEQPHGKRYQVDILLRAASVLAHSSCLHDRPVPHSIRRTRRHHPFFGGRPPRLGPWGNVPPRKTARGGLHYENERYVKSHPLRDRYICSQREEGAVHTGSSSGAHCVVPFRSCFCPV